MWEGVPVGVWCGVVSYSLEIKAEYFMPLKKKPHCRQTYYIQQNEGREQQICLDKKTKTISQAGG